MCDYLLGSTRLDLQQIFPTSNYSTPSINIHHIPSNSPLDQKHHPDIYLDQLIQLCLPIRLQHCYSSNLQNCFIILMQKLQTNHEAKQRCFPMLLSFLAQFHVTNHLWIQACETGFAKIYLTHIFDLFHISSSHTPSNHTNSTSPIDSFQWGNTFLQQIHQSLQSMIELMNTSPENTASLSQLANPPSAITTHTHHTHRSHRSLRSHHTRHSQHTPSPIPNNHHNHHLLKSHLFLIKEIFHILSSLSSITWTNNWIGFTDMISLIIK